MTRPPPPSSDCGRHFPTKLRAAPHRVAPHRVAPHRVARMPDGRVPPPHLPDPKGSRAVLVGSWTYTSMAALPAVEHNLRGLQDVLTDPDLWGLPKDHCVCLANATRDEVLEATHSAALSATDS